MLRKIFGLVTMAFIIGVSSVELFALEKTNSSDSQVTDWYNYQSVNCENPMMDPTNPVQTIGVPMRRITYNGTINGYQATTNNYVYQAFAYNTVPNYNCYLFAIGVTSVDTHNIQYTNPGFYTSTSWHRGESETSFRNKLFADLYYIGGSPRIVSSNYVPSAGEHLLCYRFAYDLDGDICDYHIMKYVSGLWLHKPSFSSILAYRKNPAASIWEGEMFYLNGSSGYWQNINNYTSNIVYVAW